MHFSSLTQNIFEKILNFIIEENNNFHVKTITSIKIMGVLIDYSTDKLAVHAWHS